MPINFDTPHPQADLFDRQAEDVANKLNQADFKLNKPTQLRRFYDELVSLQERVGQDEEKFRALEAYVRMLNAKVAYAHGRGLVDLQFRNWFHDCLAAVKNARSLTHFRLHFEAVLGFLRPLRKD